MTVRERLRGLGWRGRPSGLRAGLLRRLRGLVAAWTESPEAPVAAEGAPLEPSPSEVRLAASEVQEGGRVEVMLDGRPVLVCRVGGQVVAVGGLCPHAGGALAEGTLEDGRIVCPLHGWPFDLRSGQCEVDPSVTLERYTVREVSGEIFVQGPGA